MLMRDGARASPLYRTGLWQYTVRRMGSTVGLTSVGSPFLLRYGARFARVERHLVLGTAAVIAAAVLIDHSNSPAGFASFAIALGLTVRSFARAVDAGFGHYYGWVYGEPKMATRADRVAFRMIHRRRYGQRLTSPSPQHASDRHSYATALPDESKVRILEIDAAELLACGEDRPSL